MQGMPLPQALHHNMSDSNGDVSISLSVAWHAFPPTCANGGVYYPAFTLQVCNKDLSCLRLSVGHHGTFRVPTRQTIRWLPLRLHQLHHHNYSRYGMASYTQFASSGKGVRGFCRVCGSSLTFNHIGLDKTEILLGTVDEEILKSKVGTELCSSKDHSWCENAVKAVTDIMPGNLWSQEHGSEKISQ